VVLSSNKVDLYYYMDQPGRVPSEPAMCQLANGDIVESAAPVWGIDVKVRRHLIPRSEVVDKDVLNRRRFFKSG